MIVEAQVTIGGSKPAIWAAIVDLEHAADVLSGVEKIEILEKPARGLVGLKWRETRLLFGKPEAVDKWITEAVENQYYRTRAEIPGFTFLTTQRVSENATGNTLIGTHETRAEGLVAKLKSMPMVFFKGVLKRAILQDLNDYKAAVERKGSPPTGSK